MEPQPRKRVAITSSFFPVDESLLPQLNISPAQHEELRQYAVQVALDTVRDGPTWGRSNIEHAVSSGWKVLSARPTACFLIKKQAKKKRKSSKKDASQAQSLDIEQQQQDEQWTIPSTMRVSIPGVASLGSFHDTDIVSNSVPCQPFASIPSEAASGQHFMAHAVLPNSLEDVMNTIYCEHTREMRALKQKIYGEAALDCCVLQTLEGATLDDPFWYLGLKWLALRSPMQALMSSREFVYLEHLGTHVDMETGRRMLYRVTQSVHIRGYGGQDSYFGLTRGHVEAAFVYWMDDENEAKSPLLHVCAKGRIHMKGNMPEVLVYRYLKALWRSERSLFPANRPSMSSRSSVGIAIGNDSADQPAKRKSKTKKKKPKRRKVPSGPPLEMAQEWVADQLRPRCSVCNKKFRVVGRSKHHCRACGEIMCRECTFYHHVNVRAAQNSRTLRGSVAAPANRITDVKIAKHKDLSINFEETMTCSFDSHVEEVSNGRDFEASQNARTADDSPTETAILGDDSVLCVVMAKICLCCLQSVPLVNQAKRESTHRRRHSEEVHNGGSSTSTAANDGKLDVDEYLLLRPRTWTPGYMKVEELDGLDDDLGQTSGGELDLPMLVDDTDAESVDGLAEMKRKPRSSMNEREDGGLDSHRNNKRVMLFSPHALSTSSSLTSLQLNELMNQGEDTHESSGLTESQQSYDLQSDIDGDDKDSIQFYPTQTNRAPDDEGLGPRAQTDEELDSNGLYELKEEENELAASAAAATAAVSATERVLRRMRDLQDEALYQTQRLSSSSQSATPFCSEDGMEGDECSEIDEPIHDLRQALAQVESSLADQARLLFTIEQERKKKTASSSIFAVPASSKAQAKG